MWIFMSVCCPLLFDPRDPVGTLFYSHLQALNTVDVTKQAVIHLTLDPWEWTNPSMKNKHWSKDTQEPVYNGEISF